MVTHCSRTVKKKKKKPTAGRREEEEVEEDDGGASGEDDLVPAAAVDLSAVSEVFTEDEELKTSPGSFCKQ